MHRCPLSLL